MVVVLVRKEQRDIPLEINTLPRPTIPTSTSTFERRGENPPVKQWRTYTSNLDREVIRTHATEDEVPAVGAQDSQTKVHLGESTCRWEVTDDFINHPAEKTNPALARNGGFSCDGKDRSRTKPHCDDSLRVRWFRL